MRRGILHALVGNSSVALMQFLLIISISRFCGIEDLGRYALAMAVVTTVFFACSFSLKGRIAADIRSEFSVGDYLIFRAGVLPIALLLTVASFYFLNLDSLVLVSLFIVKGIESFSEVHQGLLIRLERHRVNKFLVFARAMSFFLPVEILILSGIELSFSLAVGALATLVAFFVERYIFFRNVLAAGLEKESVRRAGVADLLVLGRTTFPLGFAHFIISMNTNFPKILAGVMWGDAEVGIVSGLLQLGMIGVVLVNSVSQNFIPRVARLHESRNFDEIARLQRRAFALLAVPSFAFICFVPIYGDYFLKYTLGNEFVPFVWLFFLTICASAVGYLSAINFSIQTGLRDFVSQRRVAILMAVCLFALSPVLGIWMGLHGLLTGYLVANVLRFALSSYYIRSRLTK